MTALLQISRPKSPVSRSFIPRMMVHLRKHFAWYCDHLGTETLRLAVMEGIERGLFYGIQGDRDVCLFIDLLFAFGPTFDEEEDYSWTHAFLRNHRLDSATKMRLIYATGKCLTRYHRSL